MKTLSLLALGSLISPSLSLAANVRPECEEWQKKVETIVGLGKEKPELLPGKTTADLLGALASFPDESTFTLEHYDKPAREAVEGFLARPGCRMMTYWSLHKWLLTDEAFDRGTRGKSLNEVTARTLREADGEPSLISLVLRSRLYQLAIDNGTLELKDPAYFAFSRLLTDIDRLRADLREDDRREPELEQCLDPKTSKTRNCQDKMFEQMLAHFQHETRSTTALRRELVRWVRRATAG